MLLDAINTTQTKIIARCKAMVLRLLPLEVEEEDITSANGSIITRDVIQAFYEAGGDFADAIPYCLLVARGSFHKDAYRNPSDFDEHMNHKLACEVIARRVVQKYPTERQHIILSTRFSRIESDGDVSLPLSAIELASDQHCPIFLSSAESQRTVFALWKGHVSPSMSKAGRSIDCDLTCHPCMSLFLSWFKDAMRMGKVGRSLSLLRSTVPS